MNSEEARAVRETLLQILPWRDVVDPSSRFFGPYLLASVLLGIAISLRAGSVPAAISRVLRFDVFLHRSALLDYRLAFCNHLLAIFALGNGIIASATVAQWTESALDAALPLEGARSAGPVILFAYAVALIVAYDIGSFTEHWLQHRIPVLWEFHKVHHSAEVLTPVTSIRIHPVAALFGSAILSVAIGLVGGVFLYAYPGTPHSYAALAATAMFGLHYSIGAFNLQHSHIWLLFPKPLRYHLISPALHLIHHSCDPAHYNRNFAFIFTYWDRLAGTLYIPDETERDSLTLGLGAEQQPNFQSVAQLYWTPFQNVARMMGLRRFHRRGG